ncbi:MAG: substrate-binding domain-containing protein, partial [Kiritimatiellae bacterium]|nr:substrate-binding domain-containing protein [Kiritimatiellia bacterium]
DLEHLSWLTRLPVPTAFISSAPMPNRVHGDAGRFAELSLRSLARQGCRRIGLIAATSTQTTNPDGTRHEDVRFLDAFVEQAGLCGLTIRDAWIVTSRTAWNRSNPAVSGERFGYEAFLHLWAGATRPDGLVVWTDAEAQGAILAMVEKRVRVPDDLRLVLHKNAEVDMVCPYPATMVVTRADDVARDLLELVEKQFAGEEVQPLSLQFSLQETGR